MKSYLGQWGARSSSTLWDLCLCHRRPGRWTGRVRPEAVSQCSQMRCLRWPSAVRGSRPASGSSFPSPNCTPQLLSPQCRAWWSSICTCQVWWDRTPGSPLCPPPRTRGCPGTPPPSWDWSPPLEEGEDTRTCIKAVCVCVCLRACVWKGDGGVMCSPSVQLRDWLRSNFQTHCNSLIRD